MPRYWLCWVTTNCIMLSCCIRFRASVAMAVGAMVLALGWVMLAAVMLVRVLVVSSRRRISPSVIMPTSVPLLVTAVAPIRCLVISVITCCNVAVLGTCGLGLLGYISATVRCSLRPNAPPGWYLAKLVGVKPLSCIRHIANTSPITICAVVLVVGARLIGQASAAMVVLMV